MSFPRGLGFPIQLPPTPERPKSLPPIQSERNLTEEKTSQSARRNMSPMDRQIIWSKATPRRWSRFSEQLNSSSLQNGTDAPDRVQGLGFSQLVYRPKKMGSAIPAHPKPRGFIPPKNPSGGTGEYFELDDGFALPAAHSAQTSRTAFVQVVASDRLLDACDVDVLIPQDGFSTIRKDWMSLKFSNSARAYHFTNRPRCLAFYENANGLERLVLGTAKGWLDIWNVQPGMEPARLRTKKICDEPIVRVEVGGTFILAASLSGKLYQISRETQKVLSFDQARHEGRIAAMALSSDKTRLATGGADGSVIIYGKNQARKYFEPLIRMPLFEAGVSSLAFWGEQPKLLLVAGPSTLSVWNLESEDGLGEIEIDSRASSVFWLSATKLCTTHADGTIRYYNFDSGKGKIEEARRIQGHKQAIAHATYNGTDLLTTFSPAGNEIKSWTFSTPPNAPLKSAFSPYKGLPRAGRH